MRKILVELSPKDLSLLEMKTVPQLKKSTPACNSGLAKVAAQGSVDSFVVHQSLVLRINISG